MADRKIGPEGGGIGGGLNAAELQRREKEGLDGTGGSSGGGSFAGSGDVSGGTTDRGKDVASPAAGDSGDALGKGKLAAGRSFDGTRTGAEAIGAGAGRDEIGSGSPKDKGDLGGGDSRR